MVPIKPLSLLIYDSFKIVFSTRGRISFGGFACLPEYFWSKRFWPLSFLFLLPIIIQHSLNMALMCVFIFLNFFSLSISSQNHISLFRNIEIMHYQFCACNNAFRLVTASLFTIFTSICIKITQ